MAIELYEFNEKSHHGISYYGSQVVGLGLGMSVSIKNVMPKSCSEGIFNIRTCLTNILFIEIRTRRLHIAMMVVYT